MARINFKFADGFDDSYKHKQQQQEDDLLAFQYYVSFVSGEARSVHDLHPLYLAQYGRRMPWEVWPEKFGHLKPAGNSNLTNEQEADKLAKQVVNGETVDPIVANKNNTSAEQKTPPGFESTVQHRKSSGENLPDQLREEMETKLGADFSGVKIHNTTNDHALAAEAGAQALTHGQDILFGKGKYDPNSTQGKELLAHELVHAGGDLKVVQRKVDEDSPWVKSAMAYNAALFKTQDQFNGIQSLFDDITSFDQEAGGASQALRDISSNNAGSAEFAHYVAVMQKIVFPELGALLLGTGALDGKFGPKTCEAVIKHAYDHKYRQLSATLFFLTGLDQGQVPDFIYSSVFENYMTYGMTNNSDLTKTIFNKTWLGHFESESEFYTGEGLGPTFAVYYMRCRYGIKNYNAEYSPTVITDYEAYLRELATGMQKAQDASLANYNPNVFTFDNSQTLTYQEPEKTTPSKTYQTTFSTKIREDIIWEASQPARKSFNDVIKKHNLFGAEYNEAVQLWQHYIAHPAYYQVELQGIKVSRVVSENFAEEQYGADVYSMQNYSMVIEARRKKRFEDFQQAQQDALFGNSTGSVVGARDKELQALNAKYQQLLQNDYDQRLNERTPQVAQQLREADLETEDTEMNLFVQAFVERQTPDSKPTPNQQIILDAFEQEMDDFELMLQDKYNGLKNEEELAVVKKYEGLYAASVNNYIEKDYFSLEFFTADVLQTELDTIKKDGKNLNYAGKQHLIFSKWIIMRNFLLYNKGINNKPKPEQDADLEAARAEYYSFILDGMMTETIDGVELPSTLAIKSWAKGYQLYIQNILGGKPADMRWAKWIAVMINIPSLVYMEAIEDTAYVRELKKVHEALQNLIDKPEDDTSFWEDIATGIKTTNPDQAIPFLAGIMDIWRMYSIKTIADKVNNDEPVSETELMMLMTYGASQQLDLVLEESVGYMIGGGLAQAIAYIGEIALTEGLFTAGRTAVKAGIKTGLKVALKSSIKATVKEGAFGVTKKLLTKAIRLTIMNPQRLLQNITKKFMPNEFIFFEDGRMTLYNADEEMDFGDYLLKIVQGTLHTVGGYFFEGMGEHLMKVPKNIALSFLSRNKLMNRIYTAAAFRKYAMQYASKEAALFGNLADPTNMKGFLGSSRSTLTAFMKEYALVGSITEEYLEEMITTRFDRLVEGQNPFEFNLNEEVASLSVSAIISGSIQTVSVVTSTNKNTTRLSVKKEGTDQAVEVEVDSALIEQINNLVFDADDKNTTERHHEPVQHIITEYESKNPDKKLADDQKQAIYAYYFSNAQLGQVADWAFEKTGQEGNMDGYKAIISLYLGRPLNSDQIAELRELGGVYAEIADTLETAEQSGVPELSRGRIAGILGQYGITDQQRSHYAAFFKDISEQRGKNFTPQDVTDEYFVFVTREGLSADAQAQFDRFRIAGENTAAFRNRIETVSAKGSLTDYLQNRENLNAAETTRPDAGTATSVDEFTAQSTTYQKSINASPLLQGTGAGSMAAMSLRGDLQALIVAQLLAGYDAQGRAGVSGKKEKVQERFDKRSDRFFEILSDPDMSIADKKKLLTRKAKQMQRFMNRHDVTAIDFKSIFAQIDAISETNFGNRYLYNPETGMVQVDGKEITLDALKAQLEAVNSEYMFHNIARSYRIEIRQHGKGKHTRSEVIIHADKQAVPAPLSEEAQLRRAMPGVTTIEENNPQKGYAGMLDNRMYVFMNRALGANARTLLEEFSHIWLQVCDVADPKLIDGVIAEVKRSKAYQQIASDPNYKKAAESSSDATRYLVKELLAKAAAGEQLDFSAVESNTLETNPSWLKTFLNDLWEALKNALRKLGLPVKADMPATITATEFAQQIRTELTQGEVVFNATSQQLLDFIEGRSSKLDIQNSILAGKDAKGSIVAENWYANPLSPEAKQQLIQECKAILQQRNILNSSSFDPVFDQYPEESLFFMKKLYFHSGEALKIHIERRNSDISADAKNISDSIDFPEWENTWNILQSEDTDLDGKNKKIADYTVIQENWEEGTQNEGVFRQIYLVNENTVILEDAFLKFPNRKVTPLDKHIKHDGTALNKSDRTTPTFSFITVKQLKDMGIPYGSLKKYIIKDVVNFETLCQLAKLNEMNPGSLKQNNASYRELAIVQPVDTELQIYGHQISNVEIDFSSENADDITFKKLIKYNERFYGISEDQSYEIMKENGLDPDSYLEKTVKWKFEININLAKTKYNETN
jgi:hypothetical protein